MKNNIRLIVVVTALAILAYVGFLIWQNTQFRVTGTTPSTSGSVATSTSVIKIDFSHDLSEEVVYNRTIIDDGQSLVREIERRDRSLYVRIFEIFEGENYTISFKDILSSDGEVIKNFRLTFTAKYIPSERLSQAQKELENGETDRFEVEDPILKHIPYSTIGYSLEPVNSVSEEGSYALFVNMKIFLSNTDRGFEEEAVESYKKQAFDYLRSKGINSDDYEFNFIVQDPAY